MSDSTAAVTVDDEAAEYVAQWSRLPHPLEAAVLHEVNEPDLAVVRAAEVIHRRPPGVEGPTRAVWVLAHCRPSGEGTRRKVSSWCWYATRAAAEAAESAQVKRCGRADSQDDLVVVHETVVPRAVRCDDVERFLAKNYRASSAEPRC